MKYAELRKSFEEKVYPSRPNDWEVDEVLHDLETLKEEKQHILLQTIPAVWPISHSLCFSVLHEGARQSQAVNQENIAEWLRRILFHYEKGGLVQARAYMAQSTHTTGEILEERKGVLLSENMVRLTAFAKALADKDVVLQGSARIYTDTETLYLPEKIDCFDDTEENLILYKLIIGLQCGFLQGGTFGVQLYEAVALPHSTGSSSGNGTAGDIERFFDAFSLPELAKDIFQIIELTRIVSYLLREYPGLMAQSLSLRLRLLEDREKKQSGKKEALRRLFRASLLREKETVVEERQRSKELQEIENVKQSVEIGEKIYKEIVVCPGDYAPFSFLPFMDRFDFREVQQVREQRIKRNSKKFETTLAGFIAKSNLISNTPKTKNGATETANGAKIQFGENKESDASQKYSGLITINNESIELPEELLQLMHQLRDDTGALPQAQVSAAFGIAGQARPVREGQSGNDQEEPEEFIPYDEWDYRRHGYRKNWCSLRERKLHGVRSDFVERTKLKYAGALRTIHRQFEQMCTQERFTRRRRYGDDIDFDALIDALGDQRAGLPPSENVFVRLIKNERDIATVLLVDMSQSTEGWVGTTIKEALVLLCEALEIVGDRYAIFGFSGMRRMRSEVYKIKDVMEKYDAEVKKRLAAITPKDYTRMGPPIRHMTNYLAAVDAKTRLLLILSDGKPEDYDEYKGQYAIEDTRKALAEAKGGGIHTYCITIDRQAENYLAYLFGKGNYTFVKNIELLPSRLAEVYRLLTR